MNVTDVVIAFVDVSLGSVLSVNNLFDSTFAEDVKLLRAADATAERKDTAFPGVSASGRMSNSKRAVDAMAVLEFDHTVVGHVLLVAIIAEVVCSEAAEECDRAAEHALPVDLNITMLFAICLTSSHFLQETILAHEVFLFGLVITSLLLTVDESTEVRLFACVALVEGAAVVGVSLWLSVVVVTNRGESLIGKDALHLCVPKSHLFNFLLEAEERAQFASDGIGDTFKLDLLLAARARHESEGDSECGPFVLEELDDTVGVEDMAARELGACFTTEFCCVANGAQFIFVCSLEVSNALSTLGVEAREAVALLGDTFACMAAAVSLVTEGKGGCLFLLNKSSWFASVDQNAIFFLDTDCDLGELKCCGCVGVVFLNHGGHASFKHWFFLVFVDLMRNLSHHLDLFKHHHFFGLVFAFTVNCLFLFFNYC